MCRGVVCYQSGSLTVLVIDVQLTIASISLDLIPQREISHTITNIKIPIT